MNTEEKLKKLDQRMYNINANLSSLIYIQKIKTKEQAEVYLQRINKEIGEWIKELRDIYEEKELKQEVEKI